MSSEAQQRKVSITVSVSCMSRSMENVDNVNKTDSRKGLLSIFSTPVNNRECTPNTPHAKKFCSKIPLSQPRYKLVTTSQAVSVTTAMNRLSEIELPVCFLQLHSYLRNGTEKEKSPCKIRRLGGKFKF